MDKNQKTTYIIAALSLVIITIAIYFLFVRNDKRKDLNSSEQTNIVKDISQIPLAKRPYVTLTPTSDGAEIIMSLENMGEFEKIEYELTYLADNPQIAGEKIQRGATGIDVNTQEIKYKKSILLGTGSRGVRTPDTGVTEGKLTMHMIKGDTEYLSQTDWDIFEAGKTAQTLTSRNGNFEISLPTLGKNYWVILANTLGFPQSGDINSQNVILPVWGAFSIAPEFEKDATVKIKIQSDAKEVELHALNHQDNSWQKLSADFNTSEKLLSAKVKSLETFLISGK